MIHEETGETLQLLQKVWTFFLIGLYAVGFLTEYFFPASAGGPPEGHDMLWNLQRLLFFAFLFLGFLIDVVRMREDRNKAFVFLFLTLILGGFSGAVSAMQCQVLTLLFGRGEGGSMPATHLDSFS